MGCASSKNVKDDEVEAVGDLPEVEPKVTSMADPDWASNGMYTLTISNHQGATVGVSLGKLSEGGAVVLSIDKGGLLHQWNKHYSPSKRSSSITLEIGHIIMEADGATGYDEILQRISSPGIVNLVVQGATQDWASNSSETESTGSRVSVRLFSHRRSNISEDVFAQLDEVAAGACEVTECCVCMAEVPVDAKLIQLRCGHACHAECASGWLLSAAGRCPLCLTTAFDHESMTIIRVPVV
jgi:hypothetical protein